MTSSSFVVEMTTAADQLEANASKRSPSMATRCCRSSA
jgi:hypothetical protein